MWNWHQLPLFWILARICQNGKKFEKLYSVTVDHVANQLWNQMPSILISSDMYQLYISNCTPVAFWRHTLYICHIFIWTDCLYMFYIRRKSCIILCAVDVISNRSILCYWQRVIFWWSDQQECGLSDIPLVLKWFVRSFWLSIVNPLKHDKYVKECGSVHCFFFLSLLICPFLCVCALHTII